MNKPIPVCTMLIMQTTQMSPLMRRRTEAGLSRADLAKRIRTTPQTVNRWELGQRKPKERFIPRLAKALKLSEGEVVDALFTK